MVTHPVPKPKTILGYQNIITVAVSGWPTWYIIIVPQKVHILYPPVCSTGTNCTQNKNIYPFLKCVYSEITPWVYVSTW